jgi:hypothetical protein
VYHLHALIKYPERQWAYEGQRDWTEKLFTGAGIQSTKKTHSTRRGGHGTRRSIGFIRTARLAANEWHRH